MFTSLVVFCVVLCGSDELNTIELEKNKSVKYLRSGKNAKLFIKITFQIISVCVYLKRGSLTFLLLDNVMQG